MAGGRKKSDAGKEGLLVPPPSPSFTNSTSLQRDYRNKVPSFDCPIID